MPATAARGRVALLAWLVAAWLVLPCAPALAHATLVGASPPQGGEVSKPPERVELRFNEPVDAGFDPVVVRDARGARVDEHDARVDPEDARVVLAELEELPEGSYTVEWRVTSVDGHVVDGRYGFDVGGTAAHQKDERGAAAPQKQDRGNGRPDGGAARDDQGQHQGQHQGGHQGGHHGAHHGEHPGGVSPGRLGLLAEVAHGITLAACALLAGLAPFAALVWLPASREAGEGREAIAPFGPLAWGLFCVLAFSGVGELAIYATRASGEPFGFALFEEALLQSRVGAVSLARLGLALLAAAAVSAAVRWGRDWLWWAAAGTGGLLLMTLTGLSHAAATGRLLPLLADWVHATAAAVWMGGLLGFAAALFSGPLRGMDPEGRAKLRERSVRRFSNVAITAVLVLGSTGLYAVLVHVPSWDALVATPYGRALLVKLGLVSGVLAIGAANLLLRGRGPFGRRVVLELLVALGVFVATGFLTSLPPASGP